MSFLLKSLLVSSLLITLGCQTTPKFIDDGSDTGIWTGKVQIKDDAKGQNLWGYVTWISDSRNRRLRVDVEAVFGIPIATFILAAGKADLWLHRENKHYTSQDPGKLFSNLVRFSINPKIFFKLLSRRPKFSTPWNCLDKNESLNCDNMQNKILLNLKNQSQNQRQIEIKKASKTLKMALQRTKVQVESKAFDIKPTPHYKKIKM